jgi:hypothetical protein
MSKNSISDCSLLGSSETSSTPDQNGTEQIRISSHFLHGIMVICSILTYGWFFQRSRPAKASHVIA